MDVIVLLKGLAMGIVEGLTEFLPVSSTGHLVLAGSLLGFDDAKGKMFDLFIQTGAMLAVVWEYRAKFLGVLAGLGSDRAAQRFVANLVVAFLASAHVVLTKRDSRAAIGWAGIIWLTPFIGAGLYLMFGVNRIQRRARQLRRGRELVGALVVLVPGVPFDPIPTDLVTADQLGQALPAVDV